jgi:NitT/TauT family transport system ATP-binding protein
MNSVILLRDLAKDYQSVEGITVPALQNITLAVQQGEFAVIVGPSGCGKSTLLRIIAGLDRQTTGEAKVSGKEVSRPISDVGIVFQDPLLMAWRTTIGNVMLPVEILRLDRSQYRSRALDLLKLVGLAGFENRYPQELSGGMQQRVAIARALIHDPSLLLMDEPFGALDEITREQMALVLLHVWEETGKTVLFVTHSIAEAVFLGDRVVVLSPRPGTVRENTAVDLPRPRTGQIRGLQKYTEYCQIIRERLGLIG